MVNEETARAIAYAEKHQIQRTFEEALTNLLLAHPKDPMGFFYDQVVKRAHPQCISRVVGREVLDSCGDPNLEVEVWGVHIGKDILLGSSGSPGVDSAPPETAFVLVDSTLPRYDKRGMRQAIGVVLTLVSPALSGKQFFSQQIVDGLIMGIDSSPNKKKVGINTCMATSAAVAVAAARSRNIPLFQHLHEVFDVHDIPTLPRLICGFFSFQNGPISKIYLIPREKMKFSEQVRILSEIYIHQVFVLHAPTLMDGTILLENQAADELIQTIEIIVSGAGHAIGDDIFLGIKALPHTPHDLLKSLCIASSHVIYIEDGSCELRGMSFAAGTKYHSRIEHIEEPWTDIILKPTQIGSITGIYNAVEKLQAFAKNPILSTAANETSDTWICDLAVAFRVPFLQLGPPSKGENIEKINRLLQIESFLGES